MSYPTLGVRPLESIAETPSDIFSAQIRYCSLAMETLINLHAENEKENFQAQTKSRLHETGPA
jgi:hypothetical protein